MTGEPWCTTPPRRMSLLTSVALFRLWQTPSFTSHVTLKKVRTQLATHHTYRHPGRVDRKQLSDRQNKRPKPASAAFARPQPEYLLAASWGRHGRITHQTDDVPYKGFDRALFHCRTDYRRLKSMTQELRGSGLPTSGECLTAQVKHCGIQFLHDPCVAGPHTASSCTCFCVLRYVFMLSKCPAPPNSDSKAACHPHLFLTTWTMMSSLT